MAARVAMVLGWVMTRGRYILGAVVAIVAVAFVIVAVLPPTPGVTQANYDRIEDGMTLVEVEAIYGRPPDGSVLIDDRELNHVCHVWESSSGRPVEVAISNQGVIRKSWPAPDETVLRKIRHWLFPPVRLQN